MLSWGKAEIENRAQFLLDLSLYDLSIKVEVADHYQVARFMAGLVSARALISLIRSLRTCFYKVKIYTGVYI